MLTAMKLIEVVAENGHIDSIIRLARQNGAQDHWLGLEKKESQTTLHNLRPVLAGIAGTTCGYYLCARKMLAV